MVQQDSTVARQIYDYAKHKSSVARRRFEEAKAALEKAKAEEELALHKLMDVLKGV